MESDPIRRGVPAKCGANLPAASRWMAGSPSRIVHAVCPFFEQKSCRGGCRTGDNERTPEEEPSAAPWKSKGILYRRGALLPRHHYRRAFRPKCRAGGPGEHVPV